MIEKKGKQRDDRRRGGCIGSNQYTKAKEKRKKATNYFVFAFFFFKNKIYKLDVFFCG